MKNHISKIDLLNGSSFGKSSIWHKIFGVLLTIAIGCGIILFVASERILSSFKKKDFLSIFTIDGLIFEMPFIISGIIIIVFSILVIPFVKREIIIDEIKKKITYHFRFCVFPILKKEEEYNFKEFEKVEYSIEETITKTSKGYRKGTHYPIRLVGKNTSLMIHYNVQDIQKARQACEFLAKKINLDIVNLRDNEEIRKADELDTSIKEKIIKNKEQSSLSVKKPQKTRATYTKKNFNLIIETYLPFWGIGRFLKIFLFCSLTLAMLYLLTNEKIILFLLNLAKFNLPEEIKKIITTLKENQMTIRNGIIFISLFYLFKRKKQKIISNNKELIVLTKRFMSKKNIIPVNEIEEFFLEKKIISSLYSKKIKNEKYSSNRKKVSTLIKKGITSENWFTKFFLSFGLELRGDNFRHTILKGLDDEERKYAMTMIKKSFL